MMSIKVKPVNDKRELKKFIKLPWKIYKNDKYWVPPLISQMKEKFNPDKHPYHDFATLQPFLAYKDSEPVGRIVGHINPRHNEIHNENIGFFGFFESIPDQDVAKALFDTASEWVKNQGKEAIRGPMNFSTNEECGLLIKGFYKSPMIMMTYNPQYYQKYIEDYGFKKAKDIYAFWANYKEIPERFSKFMKKISRRADFTIRKLNPKKFKEEVKTVFKVYNEAWKNNWGYVPMTPHEFEHTADELKQIIDFDYVYLAEIKGKPIGFSLTLPDFYQALKKINGRLLPFGWLKLLLASRSINQVRVITLGVVPKYKNRGIDVAFYHKTIQNAMRKGQARGEMSWILEDNDRMINAAKKMGGEIYKIYRIYDKKLI